MSWHQLPTELHIAIVHRLPPHAVRALSSTSSAARVLCLPAIFANVTLPDLSALHAFARHVPAHYGTYVRSLAVCTKHHDSATGAIIPPTTSLLSILRSCSRLNSLSLSLASSLDAEQAVPVFASLHDVHSFEIGCWGTEDTSPVSERLAVALAASLPALTHLSLSRITRSAIHVDPCDAPYGVPVVTNDFDVPPHPVLGSDLALPSLLRLSSLRTLEIRDTWLGCDVKIEPAISPLKRLVLTGSMYSSSDAQCEALACTMWLHACPRLRSFEIGTALAPPPQLSSSHPRVPHVHINASRFLVDDLSATLDALSPCAVETLSIVYEPERPSAFDVDVPLSQKTTTTPDDDFARECALDDLQDWSAAVEAFLGDRTEEWSALSRVDVSLAPGVGTSWDL